MNKKIIIFLAVVVVAVVGIILLTRGDAPSGSNAAPEPQGSAMPTPDEESALFTVTFTDGGFSPRSLTVPAGAPVVFKNNSGRAMWVASDPHPLHTNYPGSDIKNCGAGTAMFDSCRVTNPGESWTFILEEPGTWGYHNHLQSSQTGTIIVELSK